MDRIREEMTENGRFKRPFKLKERSLRTVDHFLTEGHLTEVNDLQFTLFV